MTLKVRLAAMMVLILVAVLALQYLLMERERRGLLTRLEELSQNMDRTTAVFVERVRDASAGRHEPEIESLLAELSNFPDLELRDGVTLKLLAWSDSAEGGFFEESRVDVRVEFHLGDSLEISQTRLGAGSEGPQLWRPEVEDVHFSSRTSDSLLTFRGRPGRTVMVHRFLSSDSHSFGDTRVGMSAESSLARVRKSMVLGQAPFVRGGDWNSEMVINLPVGGGAADSFYSVQVRYPLDSLTDELERSRQSGFLWLGAVLGVGILGAVLVAGQFTRPIRSLQESFGRVQSGDLDVNVVPERPDEIGQLTMSFNDMVERLRDSKEVEARLTEAERLAAIGRLAAGVAHEVRNPLNTILLSMQQMRDKLHARIETESANRARTDSTAPHDPSVTGDASDPASQQVDEEFERYYRIVTGEIARLESMVSAFLDLSKSEELSFVRTDVSIQLAHAVELFRPEAESRGIRIERSGHDSLFIESDERRLPMVWNNLLANALAAAPPDSVVLVRAERQDGGILVTVEDQGAGVPAELADRIWDPFFSGRDSGTGLGLSIVRSVVERHGGQVTVSAHGSGPFPGARFAVFLPSSQEGQ